jgi:hypothetical protein
MLRLVWEERLVAAPVAGETTPRTASRGRARRAASTADQGSG